MFFKNVLDAKPQDESYYEIERSFGTKSVIIQTAKTENGLEEINEIHSKFSTGLVYLTDKDIPFQSKKKTLFVLMDRQSQQESDENTIVSYLSDKASSDCRSSFTKLVELIDQ